MTLNEILKSETPVLVDFYAEWCGPCKTMAPILKQLKDRKGEDVRIVKIDVDKYPELSGKYKISGVPTLLLFKGGKLLWRQSGVVPLQQLESLI